MLFSRGMTFIEVLISLFIISASFSSVLVLSQHQLKLSEMYLEKAYQNAMSRNSSEN